jgi:hypothetical protein
MKICFLFILTIGFCSVTGCSTSTSSEPVSSVAKYSNFPVTTEATDCTKSATQLVQEAKQKRESEEFYESYVKADLVLQTGNFQSFQEARPAEAIATLETLPDLLRHDKKLPGHGVAFVVAPHYGLAILWKPGEKPPHDYSVDVKQILEKAGFTQIHFCTDMELLRLE